jgi:23S rRNA (adenine2503-C2)-methyltransferase
MLEQIQSYFEQNKIPKFRFSQLENAYFNQFATSFDEITTFPKDLREKLKSEFELASLTLAETRESQDSTKFVFRTKDGNYIEAILMKHHDGRRTVCVSSQIFCAMGCIFCATGANKYKRNLTTAEIVEQVLFIAKHLKTFDERVSNVVFMGMGEPFLNYKNVIDAIKIFNNEKYFNIGARHITVSTAGIVPKIKRVHRTWLAGKISGLASRANRPASFIPHAHKQAIPDKRTP